jgi:hypothetical protein
MSDDFAPHASGDDGQDDPGDELAALDFSAPPDDHADSGLEALGEYVAGDEDEDSHDDLGTLDFSEPRDDDVEPQGPLFAATNPPGTITVTTYISGRVHQVDLSPTATTMTESELAQEILAVTRLASMKARSAQGAVIVDAMSRQVDDEDAIRDLVEHRLSIPTPQQVSSAEETIAMRHRAGG